jgi:hypothetical protein
VNNEEKSTQQRIDGILKELETNGLYCQQLAGELPAIIAQIEGAEELAILVATFKTFADVWRQHPEVAALWKCLGRLLERDGTRRALSEGWEIGQLQRITELPGAPGEPA